jgi:hypothetical protein
MEYTLESLKDKSYQQMEYMYRDGRISDDLWAEYQWAWRNSAVRFSTLASQYEGKPESFVRRAIQDADGLRESAQHRATYADNFPENGTRE